MGWSTSVVPAPDGDLNDYLENLERLLDRPETTYRPTHGPAITDPIPYVDGAHRASQDAGAPDRRRPGRRPTHHHLDRGGALRRHRPEDLHKAAGASVYAHLLALSRSGRVESLAEGDESDWKADWRLA